MGTKMSETSNQPKILQPGKFTQTDVDALKANPGVNIVDIYETQLEELAKITKASGQAKGDLLGAWVYFPWKNTLLHCVGPEDLFALRTNRNQLLIKKDEQAKLRDSIVGIAGMSVGAGIAKSLVYSGMSSHIKVADFDELSTSNLNRLQESLLSIGQPKAELAAQHIYELDPFSTVDVYGKGLDDSNIDKFFGQPALDLVVDEIDDFKMKVQLRVQAKKYKKPLLMFTSLGDNILVDVERYDTDADLEIFNGLLGELSQEIIDKEEITPDDERRYAVLIVGAQYVPTRALQSLLEMGKTLVGRPQLYSTIAVDGGLAAFIIRRILLGEAVKSGRYFIKFAELIGQTADDLTDSDERKATLQKLMGPPK